MTDAMQVLLVSRDPAVAGDVQAALNDPAYCLTQTVNLDEARNRLAENLYDAALVDLTRADVVDGFADLGAFAPVLPTVVLLASFDSERDLEVIRHADAAMYQAKQQGGNRYMFYRPDMNKEVLAPDGPGLRIAAWLAAPRVRAPLPTAARPRHRPRRRGRGLDPLAAPRAWPGAPGSVHPAGRGARPDGADGRLGAGDRLPPGPGLAAGGSRHGARRRQPVGPAVSSLSMDCWAMSSAGSPPSAWSWS